MANDANDSADRRLIDVDIEVFGLIRYEGIDDVFYVHLPVENIKNADRFERNGDCYLNGQTRYC